MKENINLRQFLKGKNLEHDLLELINEVASATKTISHTINKAVLDGVLGLAGSINIQDEEQKKLDIITHDIKFNHLKTTGLLAGMGSEEVDDPIAIPNEYDRGKYLIFFDPLDGSSNVDVNISVGTIFSIIKNPQGNNKPELNDYLSQNGTKQLCSGFVVYGQYTTLVLTTGSGVALFALDRSVGEYILTADNVKIPTNTQEFAINMSNQRFWEPPVQRYIADCLKGETGVLGKRYNMRWVASMVAEVYRIIIRGGIFMYPVDDRNKDVGGKLRLMYEANPISFIIEQAGGLSVTGYERILEIQPKSIHQRVPVILGSKNEVEKMLSYYK